MINRAFRQFCCLILLSLAVLVSESTAEQNENEVVFVPGKSGKIELIFMGLYGAKKIK